jgi:hypothetical protein
MYSDRIVVFLLPVGTQEIFPLGEKQFGKIRDFPFYSGNSKEKETLIFWKIRKFNYMTKS